MKVNIYKQFYTCNGSEIWEGKDVPIEKIREIEDKFCDAWVRGFRESGEISVPVLLEEVSAPIDDSTVPIRMDNKITFRMIKRIKR